MTKKLFDFYTRENTDTLSLVQGLTKTFKKSQSLVLPFDSAKTVDVSEVLLFTKDTYDAEFKNQISLYIPEKWWDFSDEMTLAKVLSRTAIKHTSFGKHS